MTSAVMDHAVDPKADLLKKVGDISDIEVFNNEVLVAIYVRPEKTKGNIIIPETNRDEDRYQGKIGLVVKMGPSAFAENAKGWFEGINPKIAVGDWIVFKASDGWPVSITPTGSVSSSDRMLCRMIEDVDVRGRVQHPDRIW